MREQEPHSVSAEKDGPPRACRRRMPRRGRILDVGQFLIGLCAHATVYPILLGLWVIFHPSGLALSICWAVAMAALLAAGMILETGYRWRAFMPGVVAGFLLICL